MAFVIKKHPYYKYNKICSYNAVFNYIVGGRGLGKTYGAKVRAVKKFIKNGEQFILLRRHKGELDSRETFFDDFLTEFPDWDFRVKGFAAQIAPASTRDEESREWDTMGWFIALSQGQSHKGRPFPRVTTIIFDEFILEEGLVHYLKNEAKKMKDFYNTVDRSQDKTTVFFLANAVSIMNPHFLEYKVMPVEGQEFMILGGGFLAVHFPDPKDFAESVYEGRFGRFIQDTEYGEYAVGNVFEDNHQAFIELKDGKAKYQYTVKSKTGTFSLWYNNNSGKYYAQEKLPGNQTIHNLVPEKLAEGEFQALLSDSIFDYLRRAWRRDKMRFDNPSTRNIFTEIFKR